MATWDRYKNNETAFEVTAYTGDIHTARFYCDDPNGGVYESKAPVAKLIVSPKVQFINTNISWDVSESDSATGTIDTFDLTFGGGGASDLTNQDWSMDPLSGTVQYTSTGTFTMTLYVTDTGGNRSQAAKVTVNVVSLVSMAVCYVVADGGAGSSNGGFYRYLPGGSPTKDTVAPGNDQNNIFMAHLNPHYRQLPWDQHHLLMACREDFYLSEDGGQSFLGLVESEFGDPTNTAGDGSPPDTDDLDPRAIWTCPQDVNRMYAVRVTDDTWNGSNDPRVFLYWADAYGAAVSDWESVGLGLDTPGSPVVAIDHNAGGSPSSFWDSVSDSAGRLSVTADAGLNGTANGLEINFPDTTAATSNVIENFTGISTGVVKVDFYVNLEDMTIPATGSNMFACLLEDGSTDIFQLQFQANNTTAGDFTINAFYYNDGSVIGVSAGTYTITASTGEHKITVEMVAETTSSSADGTMVVKVDDVTQITASAVENNAKLGSGTPDELTFTFLDTSGASGDGYIDEVSVYDALSGTYNYILSDGGLTMHSMAVSADGDYLFLALEDNDSGAQVIFRITRPVTGQTPTVTAVYEPGGGSAGNVVAVPGNPDLMVFFGNFGTDVGVSLHSISTGNNADISPASIGSDVIQPLKVDPSDSDHMLAVNVNDQDLLETVDGGTTWTALNAALGVATEGADFIFSGQLFPIRGFVAGDDGADKALLYSPNDFANTRDDSGAGGLKTVTTITGVIVVAN